MNAAVGRDCQFEHTPFPDELQGPTPIYRKALMCRCCEYDGVCIKACVEDVDGPGRRYRVTCEIHGVLGGHGQMRSADMSKFGRAYIQR